MWAVTPRVGAASASGPDNTGSLRSQRCDAKEERLGHELAVARISSRLPPFERTYDQAARVPVAPAAKSPAILSGEQS